MKHKDLFLKLAVILIAFVMSVSCVYAQDSYRIKSIYRTYKGEPDLNFYLYYQQDGRISKAETENIDDYECNESIYFVYDDANGTITMTGDDGYIVKSTIRLNNGKISSHESVKYRGSSGYETDKTNIYYDNNDCVKKITYNEGDTESAEETYEWNNGNVTKIIFKTTYHDDSVSEYEYTDYPNPKSNTLFSPYFEDFDAFYILYAPNYFSNLMGVRTKNLPKRFVKNYDYGEPRIEDYSYIFDDNGNISEITVMEDGIEYFHFWLTYETYIDTSVPGLEGDNRKPAAYYNSLGQKIETPEKGLNIIKYSNNTVKKIIVQ